MRRQSPHRIRGPRPNPFSHAPLRFRSERNTNKTAISTTFLVLWGPQSCTGQVLQKGGSASPSVEPSGSGGRKLASARTCMRQTHLRTASSLRACVLGENCTSMRGHGNARTVLYDALLWTVSALIKATSKAVHEWRLHRSSCRSLQKNSLAAQNGQSPNDTQYASICSLYASPYAAWHMSTLLLGILGSLRFFLKYIF